MSSIKNTLQSSVLMNFILSYNNSFIQRNTLMYNRNAIYRLKMECYHSLNMPMKITSNYLNILLSNNIYIIELIY